MSKPFNVEVNLREVRGDVGKLIRKFMKKVKKEAEEALKKYTEALEQLESNV